MIADHDQPGERSRRDGERLAAELAQAAWASERLAAMDELHVP